jgi:peptidoglycan/xylan/chitin deacetylase (PgdA/CDA1 family)
VGLAVALAAAGCLTPGAPERPVTVSAPGAPPAVPVPRVARANRLPVPPGGLVPRPAGEPGGLTVLDWAGFRGAVTYTFDDANSSQIDHYAELQALGVPMTFYLITSKREASDPIWARAVADGHELGNHSHRHAHAGTGADLDAATDFIRRTFGADVWTMASPYGDGSYPPLAPERFLANRGVMGGLVGPNDDADPFNLYCWVPPALARAGAYNVEVDAARQAGKWLIVLVHGFTGGSDGAYQAVDFGEFVAAVEHAKAFGDLWLDSLVDVAAYWRAQKMFSRLSPTKVGDVATWTWTLPPHFPPGRVLRVKTTGGSLAQAGKPLEWNPHGYYEIALDAGAVTLSP